MIDRKTLWIAGTFVIVMLAAAIWRIALPPDWTLLPVAGGTIAIHSYRALVGLFFGPLWMVVFTGLVLAREWFSRNPKEELRPWKSQGDLMLIVCGALVTAMQLFGIAHSLGMTGSLAPRAVARAGFVLTGALMIAIGNQLPKLPWLQSRMKLLELDAVRGTKLLRFTGWVTVAFGICLIVSASIVPAPFLMPVITGMWLGCAGLLIFRRIQLKRQQPH